MNNVIYAAIYFCVTLGAFLLGKYVFPKATQYGTNILENLENNSIAEAGQPALVSKAKTNMIREGRKAYRKNPKTEDGPDSIQPSLFDIF